MDKTWRPINWSDVMKSNISRVGGLFNGDTPVIFEDDRLVFEAGADAMLRAVLTELKRSYEIKDEVFFWNPQVIRELLSSWEGK